MWFSMSLELVKTGDNNILEKTLAIHFLNRSQTTLFLTVGHIDCLMLLINTAFFKIFVVF